MFDFGLKENVDKRMLVVCALTLENEELKNRNDKDLIIHKNNENSTNYLKFFV